MRYLLTFGLLAMFAIGCTDNSIEENEELKKIEEFDLQKIEKEDYEVPENG
ncbi:hypothetical protein [uncultured Aquimarina sp.]|uniref:hypothetical protein n=1 Tax=uncultured Aquimarina sp. TaxID=575652 RepID=UPI002605CF83|nr:hypothetical protein [uncultured Aquimarina sp.]